MPYEQPVVHDRSDNSPPAQAAPAVAFGELPGELSDDILGESPPEHGSLGYGFVGLLYTIAPLQLALGVYILATDWDPGMTVGMLPAVLFFPLLYVWLARSIQRFRLQGWGVAMLGLLLAAFSTLRLLLGDPDGIEILVSLATGALEVAWIRYFWMHRPDFT